MFVSNFADTAVVTPQNAGWEKMVTVYSEIIKFRLQPLSGTEELSDNVEEIIDSLEDGDIAGLNAYESELITAFLYGSLAYINSDDPSFKMFFNIRKAKRLFKKLNSDYKKQDSEFGTALTDIALGMYFQGSFWVRSVLRYEGNIFQGLKILDEIAFKDCMTRIEANLFMIEYYSDILNDHRSSIKYSQNLYSLYTDSKYFMYLYAKDLYHTGKIREAYVIFKKVNDNIGTDRYLGFEYESIIYEAKCLYLTGTPEKGLEVLKYAENIHAGYITEQFRDNWVFSVGIRQKVLFRPEPYPPEDYSVSDDELERKSKILFDHGFFRETARMISNIKKKNAGSYITDLRAAINMADFEKAEKLIQFLEDEYSGFMENNPDRLRMRILINITMNYLENK
jgi:hypothetical protein